MSIEEKKDQVAKLQEELNGKFKLATDFIENGNLEEAEKNKNEISEAMAEIKELEEEIIKMTNEEPVEEESEDQEEPQEEEAKAEAEEPVEVRSEDKDQENNMTITDGEGEKRNMDNIVNEEVVIDNMDKELEGYRSFLMTGETRDVKLDDDGVLVPEEVVSSIEDMTEDLDSLERFVTVKNVRNLSGTYPVRNDGTNIAPLPTVAELEESPELGLRKLGNQKYEIKTHRGLIKASWEAIDDGVEVESIINEEMAEAIVATKNKAILDALADLDETAATSIDDIKTVLNLTVAKRYAKDIVVSTDVYDALDKMKDENGQYLLQPSVTAASGTRFLGKNLVVMDADVIGEGTMYVGSLKDAVILFLRKELYVKYEIWNQYGKVFTPIVRLDAKVKNPKAVAKLKFNVEADPGL